MCWMECTQLCTEPGANARTYTTTLLHNSGTGSCKFRLRCKTRQQQQHSFIVHFLHSLRLIAFSTVRLGAASSTATQIHHSPMHSRQFRGTRTSPGITSPPRHGAQYPKHAAHSSEQRQHPTLLFRTHSSCPELQLQTQFLFRRTVGFSFSTSLFFFFFCFFTVLVQKNQQFF